MNWFLSVMAHRYFYSSTESARTRQTGPSSAALREMLVQTSRAAWAAGLSDANL